jgi:hypothetical protein
MTTSLTSPCPRGSVGPRAIGMELLTDKHLNSDRKLPPNIGRHFKTFWSLDSGASDPFFCTEKDVCRNHNLGDSLSFNSDCRAILSRGSSCVGTWELNVQSGAVWRVTFLIKAKPACKLGVLQVETSSIKPRNPSPY